MFTAEKTSRKSLYIAIAASFISFAYSLLFAALFLKRRINLAEYRI